MDRNSKNTTCDATLNTTTKLEIISRIIILIILEEKDRMITALSIVITNDYCVE
jgi:hypothetical protein